MMKKCKNVLSTIQTSFILQFVPLISFAQIKNPLGNVTDIPTIISNFLSYVVKIGGVVAIFAFIYVGFLFVKAQGNPTEIENAKKTFVTVCIGVAILLGAQLIASIIIGTVKSIGR
jgi:hypothetical protein